MANLQIRGLTEKGFEYISSASTFLDEVPVVSLFRKIFYFIKRLHRWFPVLWNQQDWDYEGVYSLLKQKMEDLKYEMLQDTWHDEKEIKKCIRQIDTCLARLDRYMNWTDYYDYPIDDLKMIRNSEGNYILKYFSEENEKQRVKAPDFEEKNFKKFWLDFTKWHRNWWT